METEYRVVFAGKSLDGFASEEVRKVASARLKASPEQIARIFSGKPAVLKKGLTEKSGAHYVTELRRIGMDVRLESNTPPSTMPTPKAPEAPGSNDLEKTQVATPDALARYLRDEPNMASAPTLVMPRASQLAVEKNSQADIQTLVVTREAQDAVRQQIAQSLSAMAANPSSAPTLIVNKGSHTDLALPPSFARLHATGPELQHDPERTLIANSGALEAYLAANPIAPGASNQASATHQHESPHFIVQNPAGIDTPVRHEPVRMADLSESSPPVDNAAPMRQFQAIPRPSSAPDTQNTEKGDKDGLSGSAWALIIIGALAASGLLAWALTM